MTEKDVDILDFVGDERRERLLDKINRENVLNELQRIEETVTQQALLRNGVLAGNHTGNK